MGLSVFRANVCQMPRQSSQQQSLKAINIIPMPVSVIPFQHCRRQLQSAKLTVLGKCSAQRNAPAIPAIFPHQQPNYAQVNH
jgi:hypothetical protein